MHIILQKRIEEAARQYLLHEHKSPLNEILHQCDLKTEMQYHKDIENAFIAGNTFALQNQWISVDEALPEDKTKVFVIVKTPVGIVHRADYHINDYWYMSRYSPEEIVTHWMIVPQTEGGEE